MVQQQQKKTGTTLININTVVTGICTAVLIWFGGKLNKVYDAILLQPGIDQVQTSAISNLISIESEQNKSLKNLNDRLIIVEAILPDKRQFKIR